MELNAAGVSAQRRKLPAPIRVLNGPSTRCIKIL
jgi:hypothetical protein